MARHFGRSTEGRTARFHCADSYPLAPIHLAKSTRTNDSPYRIHGPGPRGLLQIVSHTRKERGRRNQENLYRICRLGRFGRICNEQTRQCTYCHGRHAHTFDNPVTRVLKLAHRSLDISIFARKFFDQKSWNCFLKLWLVRLADSVEWIDWWAVTRVGHWSITYKNVF